MSFSFSLRQMLCRNIVHISPVIIHHNSACSHGSQNDLYHSLRTSDPLSHDSQQIRSMTKHNLLYGDHLGKWKLVAVFLCYHNTFLWLSKNKWNCCSFLNSRQRMQRINSEFFSEVLKVWMSFIIVQSIICLFINLCNKLVAFLSKCSLKSKSPETVEKQIWLILQINCGYFLKGFSSKAWKSPQNIWDRSWILNNNFQKEGASEWKTNNIKNQ